jgi:hypothetical protein
MKCSMLRHPHHCVQIEMFAWKLPWIVGADVGDGDDALDVAAAAVELAPEVEAHQLFLRRKEAEPGGQLSHGGGVDGGVNN